MDTPIQAVPKVEAIFTLEDIIKQVEASGVNLGDDPKARVNTFTNEGLLPPTKNGRFPSWTVQRIIAIQDKLLEGKSLADLKEETAKERRRFLNQATDLHSMANLYKKFSNNSMFMMASFLFLALVVIGAAAATIAPNNPVVVAGKNTVRAALDTGGNVAKKAASPVGRTLVTIIKTGKPEDSTSADPLQLTNLEAVSPVLPENLVQLDDYSNLIVKGEVSAITFSGSGVNLTDLLWSSLTGRPKVLSAIDGVGDDEGNINLVAGTGIFISSDDDLDTITISNIALGSSQAIFKTIAVSGQSDVSADLNNDTLTLVAGSNVVINTNAANDSLTIGVTGTVSNADTLDLLDSAAFLRSNTSDSFTSGALTLNAGAALQINGSFSCTNCVGDAAIPNTITASNYLPLAGGTMAGNIDFGNNLAQNIGAAGTDFTAGGGLTLANDLTVNANSVFNVSSAGGRAISAYYLPGSTPSTYGTEMVGIWANYTYTGPTATENMFPLFVHRTSIINSPGNTLTVAYPVFKVGGDDIETAGNLNFSSPLAVFNQSEEVNTNEVVQIFSRAPGDLLHLTATEAGTTPNGLIVTATNTRVITDAIDVSDADIVNSINIGSNPILTVGGSGITVDCAAGNVLTDIDVDGGAVTNGSCAANDYAERFPSTQQLTVGDVVAIDTINKEHVVTSSEAYQSTILGVVTAPNGLVIGEVGTPIALLGRVSVKVSTEGGAIEPGDPLTSFSTPGVAMKATKSGPIIGKALEAYSGSGVGKIMVFVSVGWFVAPLEANHLELGANLTDVSVETLTVGAINTQVLIVGDRKLLMGTTGALAIDGDVKILGDLIANRVVTDELVVSEETSGTDIIKAGQSKITIDSTKVSEKSKILVTFSDDYSPATRYWVTKKSGESFTVHLNQPATSKVSFDWLIIN